MSYHGEGENRSPKQLIEELTSYYTRPVDGYARDQTDISDVHKRWWYDET